MVCKKCGRQVTDNARFCDGCGATIKQDMSGLQKADNKTNTANVRNTTSKTKNKVVSRFIAPVLSFILMILLIVAVKTVIRVGAHQAIDKLGSLIGVNKDEESETEAATDGTLDLASSLQYIEVLQNAPLNDYPDTTVYDMFEVVFKNVEYTAYRSGNNMPLVIIEADYDGSHYGVTFILIGDEEFKQKYGDQFIPSYSDEFYVASAVIDGQPVVGDDFVEMFLDFYEENL